MLKVTMRRKDTYTNPPVPADTDWAPLRGDDHDRLMVRDETIGELIGPSNAPTPAPGDQGSVIAQLRKITSLLGSINTALSAAHPW